MTESASTVAAAYRPSTTDRDCRFSGRGLFGFIRARMSSLPSACLARPRSSPSVCSPSPCRGTRAAHWSLRCCGALSAPRPHFRSACSRTLVSSLPRWWASVCWSLRASSVRRFDHDHAQTFRRFGTLPCSAALGRSDLTTHDPEQSQQKRNPNDVAAVARTGSVFYWRWPSSHCQRSGPGGGPTSRKR